MKLPAQFKKECKAETDCLYDYDIEEKIYSLHFQWLDERRDFKGYIRAMKNMLPDGYRLIQANRKPFGMILLTPSSNMMQVEATVEMFNIRVFIPKLDASDEEVDKIEQEALTGARYLKRRFK